MPERFRLTELIAALSLATDLVLATYARIVGCDDYTAAGPRPYAEGSTVPGFRVVEAVMGSELVLAGQHRFSSYALIFRIEQVCSDRLQLRAESRAVFPGLAGGVYRLLVIGTGGHAVAVRHVLASIRDRSERRESLGTRLRRVAALLGGYGAQVYSADDLALYGVLVVAVDGWPAE
jgi:hypothetical protein